MTPTEALARAHRHDGRTNEFNPERTIEELAALGYEVRPIEPAGSLPASGEALNSPKGSQVGAETPRAAVHAGLDTPGTHGGSVKPAIEQAAEERSSESGDPDTRGRASGFAPSSAAVAPLDMKAVAAGFNAVFDQRAWSDPAPVFAAAYDAAIRKRGGA